MNDNGMLLPVLYGDPFEEIILWRSNHNLGDRKQQVS
jgi:hypothetical protein